MTREEKLITMNRQTLIGVAEKHGIKVGKKEGSQSIIKKILKAEGEKSTPQAAVAERAIKKTRGEKSPGPAARIVLTHNGKTQGMCAWAREIGIHSNLLYYRIKAGWPLEKALTPARAKKAK